MKTDCHGVTFCDGTLWVNDDQVDKILQGDEYEKLDTGAGDTPVPGDIVVYRDKKTGEVVHTVTVTRADSKARRVTEVEGLGGVETQQHKDPPGPGPSTVWTKDADTDIYRKSQIPMRPTKGSSGQMGPPCPTP